MLNTYTKNKIGCLSCDKIFDRPIELSGVERMSPPLNLKLPVCACIGLAKIPILVQAKLAQTWPEKGGG
jgi:hypothetical protein